MSSKLTALAKTLAREAGFAAVGIARAGEVDPAAAERFRLWVRSGLAGPLDYLRRHEALRRDARLLVPGARSVICLAATYPDSDHPQGTNGPSEQLCEEASRPACRRPSRDSQSQQQTTNNEQQTTNTVFSLSGLIARYAAGRDYHKTLTSRCRPLMDRLRQEMPGFDGRAFVDSGPVMERTWAVQAGLGWIGRNGCLTVPGLGSYVLLCEIFCNLDLLPDPPLPGGCDQCDRCVRACPTGALRADGLVDCRLCISCLTIEQEEAVEAALWPRMQDRLFGCDACQEACPHNPARSAPAPVRDLLEVLGWDDAQWDRATRGRALRRASLEMFLRNAAIACGNAAASVAPPLRPVVRAALEKLAQAHPSLAGPAEWALRRLGG